jgi:uncharacterized protein (DUF736 family)
MCAGLSYPSPQTVAVLNASTDAGHCFFHVAVQRTRALGLFLAGSKPETGCASNALGRNACVGTFFPRAKAHSSRNQESPAVGILRMRSGRKRCGVVRLRPVDRHRGRGGRGARNQQEIIMAQIGTFTRNEDGTYVGAIKTLSLNIKARLVPAESSANEKAPDLRVLVGNVEIGAAWKKTSKENTVYHSVKLDDPSFTAPIYANLVEVDGSYSLVWSR